MCVCVCVRVCVCVGGCLHISFKLEHCKSLVVIQCKGYIGLNYIDIIQDLVCRKVSWSPCLSYKAKPVHQRMPSLNTVQTTHTLFAQKHSREA